VPWKCPETLQLIYVKRGARFPNLTTIMKIYIALPITSCEAEKNFFKLSIIKNKFWSTKLEERMNYLFILSV
jgi:hypothetical protein